MAELVVGLENNQKILIPTSSEARSGNPLGTILAIHSNAVPYGYLPCNGVAFDEHQYPALYAMLGDNHTPVEGHTLDWDNAESITISTTDYVIQKNGWLVGHSIGVSVGDVTLNGVNISRSDNASTYNYSANIQIEVKKGDVIKSTVNITSANQNYHIVPYKYYKVIKATSGLEETQQDYVLQSLLEADSYSTEEVATGKKWIDGKMIYRRVGVCLTQGSTSSNQNYSALDMSANNVESVIDGRIIEVGSSSARYVFNSCLWRIGSNGALSFWCSGQGWSPAETGNTRYVVVEYTKAD